MALSRLARKIRHLSFFRSLGSGQTIIKGMASCTWILLVDSLRREFKVDAMSVNSGCYVKTLPKCVSNMFIKNSPVVLVSCEVKINLSD
jgi:hypothetical protein